MTEDGVAVKVRLASGQMPTVAGIWNVSLGGVFFEMKEPLPFGVEVGLEFSLPVDPHVVRCKGFVVWSTKSSPEKAPGRGGVGLRLADIKIAEMRALARAVGRDL